MGEQSRRVHIPTTISGSFEPGGNQSLLIMRDREMRRTTMGGGFHLPKEELIQGIIEVGNWLSTGITMEKL
jgi:hypothetical protein